MKSRIAVGAAATLFCVGAVAQIWLPRIGETAMLLGIMCALAAIVLRQQTLLRRVARHERLITQVQKSVANGKTETTMYGASILRRVKRLTDEAGAPSGTPVQRASTAGDSGTQQADGSRPGSGRASTPEVSNPLTDESLHTMLAPGRALTLAGVFSPESVAVGEHAVWIPSDVIASLERERPAALLIDEREIQRSPRWSSATTGAGTALMRELLAGIEWARTHGVPAYLLPAPLPADVHSSALRRPSVLALPLDDAALEASAGAPQTPLLQRLQTIAVERIGAQR